MTFTREDVQLLRDAANVFDPDIDDVHNQMEDLADRIDEPARRALMKEHPKL